MKRSAAPQQRAKRKTNRTKAQAAKKNRKRLKRKKVVARQRIVKQAKRSLMKLKDSVDNIRLSFASLGAACEDTRKAVQYFNRVLQEHANDCGEKPQDIRYRMRKDVKDLLDACDPAVSPARCAIVGDRVKLRPEDAYTDPFVIDKVAKTSGRLWAINTVTGKGQWIGRDDIVGIVS